MNNKRFVIKAANNDDSPEKEYLFYLSLYNKNSTFCVNNFKFFKDKNSLYFFVEYIDGALNIYDASKRPEIMDDIIKQCYHILQSLNDAHIVHGDINVDNLLYCNGLVMLIDFGSAFNSFDRQYYIVKKDGEIPGLYKQYKRTTSDGYLEVVYDDAFSLISMFPKSFNGSEYYRMIEKMIGLNYASIFVKRL